jgi:hypothetical protein
MKPRTLGEESTTGKPPGETPAPIGKVSGPTFDPLKMHCGPILEGSGWKPRLGQTPNFMWLRRIIQLVALVMVGDGVVGFFRPRWHSLLWKIGPKAYRELMEHFAEEPTEARWLYALEAVLGAWAATRLT